MTELNPLQTALLRVIMRFVRRQSLVLAALRDLHPRLVAGEFGREDLTPPPQYPRTIWQGFWGPEKEWAYILHGAGCRLTHTVTNERLEWDIGDLNRFDRFWFTNYLEWLLNSDPTDADVSLIRVWLHEMRETWVKSRLSSGPMRDAVFSVLEELAERGILSRDEQYYAQSHYVLAEGGDRSSDS